MKPLRRHPDPGVRRVGGVLAMLARWLTFDLSAMATWGELLREPSMFKPALLALAAFQAPLAWLAARVAFAEEA